MSEFTINDYSVKKIRLYLIATKKLVKMYKHVLRHPRLSANDAKIALFRSKGCPYCHILRDTIGCDECPWYVFEGNSCASFGLKTFSHPTEKDCHNHLERLARWRAKFEERLKELTEPVDRAN